jgi:hypothetical protein
MPALWVEQTSKDAQYSAFARAALTKQNGRFALFGRKTDVKVKGVEVSIKCCN